MAWEVEILPEAEAFLKGLEEDDYALLDAAIRVLEEQGPNLGEPFVKRIKASAHKNMKELRRQSKGKIFRILFAFDAKRRAVLLVGGDKAEIGFDDFYSTYIPVADRLFADHIKAMGESEAKAKKQKKGKR